MLQCIHGSGVSVSSFIIFQLQVENLIDTHFHFWIMLPANNGNLGPFFVCITIKCQLVDVYLAALFKRAIAKQWTDWMALRLKEAYEKAEDAQEVSRQQSGNYIAPSLALCVIWSNKAWEQLKSKKTMIRKKAKQLHMLGVDEEITPFMPDYYGGNSRAKMSFAIQLNSSHA